MLSQLIFIRLYFLLCKGHLCVCLTLFQQADNQLPLQAFSNLQPSSLFLAILTQLWKHTHLLWWNNESVKQSVCSKSSYRVRIDIWQLPFQYSCTSNNHLVLPHGILISFLRRCIWGDFLYWDYMLVDFSLLEILLIGPWQCGAPGWPKQTIDCWCSRNSPEHSHRQLSTDWNFMCFFFCHKDRYCVNINSQKKKCFVCTSHRLCLCVCSFTVICV